MPDPTPPSFAPGEILTAGDLNTGFAVVTPVQSGTLTPATAWANVPALAGAGATAQNGQAQALLNRTESLNPDNQSAPAMLDGSEGWALRKAGTWGKATLRAAAQYAFDTYAENWLAVAGSVATAPALLLSRFVTPDHFQLVGDGSDETAKLSALIAYAAQKRIPIEWNQLNATYGFTNIAVFVGGGLFDWRGRPRFQQLSTAVVGNNAIEIGGATVATVNVTATAIAGATSITVDNASQILPGQLLRLTTNRLMYGDHRFDPNNAFSQLVKARGVSGTTVTLYDPLVFDFPVATLTSGTAQAGAAGSITLAAADTATALQLNGMLLSITGGTGAGQSRYIQAYNATTKVADIGTTYTAFAQAPFSPAPDATSQYTVTQTVTATIYQPADTGTLSFEATGYSALNLIVQGVQVSFCNEPVLMGGRIGGFSNKALYTYRCYKPRIIGCHLWGANYGTSTGDGLGYGHVSIGDFGAQILGCTADNCRTGFDGVGGTIYLERANNVVTGGGATYDGNLFWPANTNYINSGLSCHTGSYGINDHSNVVCDVYDNKLRGMKHSIIGNTLRGQLGMCFQFSYSDGGVIMGNNYDDGITQIPSNGMNGNNDGTGAPYFATPAQRAQAFVQVRLNTMVSQASVQVLHNRAKSLLEAGVYPTDLSVSDLALDVRGNSFDIIAITNLTTAVVKPNSGTVGASGYRQLTMYNNDMQVGGAALGTVKSDNMNKYPIIDLLATASPFVIQTGLSQWTVILPNNSAANIAVPLGQGLFKLRVYEKDYAVTNLFEGIVQRGNITPIVASTSTLIGWSTAVLTGTTGTSGNVTISNRTDGTMYIENRSGSTGKFIVSVESINN